MPRPCPKPVGEAGLRGFKYFRLLGPLLQRLHDVGTTATKPVIANCSTISTQPCCSSTSSTPSSPACAVCSEPVLWIKCKNSWAWAVCRWDRSVKPAACSTLSRYGASCANWPRGSCYPTACLAAY